VGIAVTTEDGEQLASVMAFTFGAGKITEIYILADRSRLARSSKAWAVGESGAAQ
jgi:hypothetical protein